MLLIKCEINLLLKWSANCFLIAGTVAKQEVKFAINEIKLSVPVVTLSTQKNAKLLEKLINCFKRTINWNKH